MEPLIVVIPDTAAGRMASSLAELTACARRLAAESGGSIKAVLVGGEAAALERATAGTGGAYPALAVVVPGLEGYNGDIFRAALCEVLAPMAPRYVLAAHSSQGLDFAPALAVGLHAACITGVESFHSEEGALVFVRPVYGGKFAAHLRSTAATTVLTIQPGAFKPDGDPPPGEIPVEIRTLSGLASRSHLQGVKPSPAGAGGIAEAEVLVAAGHGLGGPENLELIRRLAACFPKSAVAGSRIACDLGWLEYRRQVGVTGATVSPKLYIACGISGALQHVAGMRSSGFVVAINKDPAAAIFHHADVCIVDDLMRFIPAFLEAASGSAPTTAF
jgi:electron transfer flavoprotein alpha subunit